MELTTFPIKSLPWEIRTQIYPLNFGLQIWHDNRIPPLLLALASEPELFAEALTIYKRINFSLSAPKANTPQELAFKRMRMRELLRIRHIKLVWQPKSEGGIFDKFSLSAHKILLKNNFETLTFVLERGCDFSHPKVLPQYLMVASSVGVRRVVLRLGDPDRQMGVKAALDKLCGSEGILRELVEVGDVGAGRRGWKEGVWSWDGMGGMCLDGRGLTESSSRVL